MRGSRCPTNGQSVGFVRARSPILRLSGPRQASQSRYNNDARVTRHLARSWQGQNLKPGPARHRSGSRPETRHHQPRCWGPYGVHTEGSEPRCTRTCNNLIRLVLSVLIVAELGDRTTTSCPLWHAAKPLPPWTITSSAVFPFFRWSCPDNRSPEVTPALLQAADRGLGPCPQNGVLLVKRPGVSRGCGMALCT